jgi:MFS family permease
VEKIRTIIGKEGNVYKLAVAMIVAYIQGSTVWTVLPLYLKEVGLQTVEIGFLMTLSGLIGIVSGVVSGKISDIVGRKPVIVVGLLGYAIPWIIFWQTKSTPFFYLARIIDGFTLQMFFTANTAFIADHVPSERMGTVMGIFQSIQRIGMAIGPAVLIGVILNQFGYDIYFMVCITIFIVSGLLVLFFVKEEKVVRKKIEGKSITTEKKILNNDSTFRSKFSQFSKPFMVYMGASIIIAIGQTMIMPIFAIFLSEVGLSIGEIGLMNGIVATVTIATPALFGKLADTVGKKKVLVYMRILGGISSLLWLWVQTFTHALLLSGLRNMVIAAAVPVGTALLTDLLPSSERGFSLGLYNSILRTNSTIMGVLGSILVQYYGFDIVFILGCVSTITGAMLIQFFVKVSDKKRIV